MSPRISLLVNNFNYAKFLRPAIDSVLNQDLTAEVVVVDDGSTDSSRDVIREYGSRIVPLFQPNQGQGAAVANAFRHSTGEIIIILDADDTLRPGALSRIQNEFASNTRLARLQWPMAVTDASGSDTGSLTPDPSAMASGDLAPHILRFRTHVWPATSGNAYSRAVLDKLLPAPADYRIGIDLYLAETTPFFGDVVSLDQPLSNYRDHGTNMWLGRDPDGPYLRDKIDMTMRTHRHVVDVAREAGFACSDDPTEALDVAFICQRLASLRLDAPAHPIPSDSRLQLVASGLRAAVLHPHHSPTHKLKRIIWILGVGLGSRRIAKRLVNRFYG